MLVVQLCECVIVRCVFHLSCTFLVKNLCSLQFFVVFLLSDLISNLADVVTSTTP